MDASKFPCLNAVFPSFLCSLPNFSFASLLSDLSLASSSSALRYSLEAHRDASKVRAKCDYMDFVICHLFKACSEFNEITIK